MRYMRGPQMRPVLQALVLITGAVACSTVQDSRSDAADGSEVGPASTTKRASSDTDTVDIHVGNVPANDFNGDGMSDILWRNDAGVVATWDMNDGTVTKGNSFGSVPGNWTIAGTGDFNGDHIVDAADYVSWRKNNGTPGGYNAWRRNFGNAVPSGGPTLGGSAAVPEPSTVLLVLLGVAAMSTSARRRRT